MNKKNIIMLIVVVIILGFAGFYLFNKDTSNNPLSAESTTKPVVGAQDIYSSLQKMAKVRLDDSIFSNQIFQSLKDNSIDVSPQETRKSNPFTPINYVAGTTLSI